MKSNVINACFHDKYLTFYWLTEWQYKHIDKTNLACITDPIVSCTLFEKLGHRYIITGNQVDDMRIGEFTLSPIIKTFDEKNLFYDEFYRYFNISYPTIQVDNELIPLWDYDSINNKYTYIVPMYIYKEICNSVSILNELLSPLNYINFNIPVILIQHTCSTINQYRFCQDINKRIGITSYMIQLKYINKYIGYMSRLVHNYHGYRVYTHYDEKGDKYIKNKSMIEQILSKSSDNYRMLTSLILYGEVTRLMNIDYFKKMKLTINFNSNYN